MSEQNHPDDHVPIDETWADVPADETIAEDAVPLCPDCWTANDPANHLLRAVRRAADQPRID